MHIHSFGLIAEYIVIIKYFLKGYWLLEHRWKSKVGEIDIIFKKRNLIVFCEVKARSSKNIFEENLVSYNQKRRIINAVSVYIDKNKLSNKEIRLDLVLVHSIADIKIFHNWIERF